MKASFDMASGRDARDALRVSDGRERDEEHDGADELWALAFAQTLVDQLPRLTLPDAELGAPPRAHPAREVRAAPAPEAIDSGPSTGDGDGTSGASETRGVPAELRAEVSDERFGRLSLHVARAEAGLDIVISVADSSVKALIEAERAILVKTLKDAGLHVARVQIGGPVRAGTALAVERGGPEKPRLGPGYQKPGARRTYPGSVEQSDTESEGLDFTA
jgi:hypothetical protein